MVPVIILHGWGGRAREYDELATYLQAQGHAVILPDLRGHGGSRVLRQPNQNTGIDLKALKGGDFQINGRSIPVRGVMDYMQRKDMEAVKAFLMERNNAGELNIELLCVVAVEEMSIAALNWAAQDWSWAQYPNLKQGQDVKALVLISPTKVFKGAHATDALRHPIVRNKLSVMLVVGKQNPRIYHDVKSLHTTLERGRPPLPRGSKAKLEVQDLFLIEKPTSLQGEKLLDPRFEIDIKIAGFIKIRLVNQSDHPDLAWRERR